MLSMNRLDYNRLTLSPVSDFLKNSAPSSAAPRLRVKIDSLDLPLTPSASATPLKFLRPMNDDVSRRGSSLETRRNSLILLSDFSEVDAVGVPNFRAYPQVSPSMNADDSRRGSSPGTLRDSLGDSLSSCCRAQTLSPIQRVRPPSHSSTALSGNSL